MKCMPCQFADELEEAQHCFGQTEDCDCSCKAHMLEEDDVRKTFMALLAAEAHEEYDMLRDLVVAMEEPEMAACLIIAVKYVTWMVKEAGIDPVEQVQEAALFWSGGEPHEDDDETDDGEDDPGPLEP